MNNNKMNNKENNKENKNRKIKLSIQGISLSSLSKKYNIPYLKLRKCYYELKDYYILLNKPIESLTIKKFLEYVDSRKIASNAILIENKSLKNIAKENNIEYSCLRSRYEKLINDGVRQEEIKISDLTKENNRNISIEGKTLYEISNEYNIKYCTLYSRYSKLKKQGLSKEEIKINEIIKEVK